ncbi:hypothetical protein PENSPDRAFT_689945 [Peniophora sp. CONT]|nr:hypothetical protein PENSPDRAFT_689945 [Peniophora sp. CONT]
MFPITCNAFGDIVAVIQLVLELVKALDDTRGAAVKYRLFVQELESLSIMMGEAYRVAEGAPSTLQLLVLKEIQICTNNIEDAYRRTRGFEKLGESSQKRTVKTKLLKRLVRKPLGLAAKKAHWHFRRTTDAQKYREIFRDCLQRLDFIVGLISCCRLNAQIPAIVHYNIEHVIIFIDAFGERIPVALQLCRSMEVFHGFLTYLFENHQRKGSTFVRQGLYELYTGEDHRVITPSIWLSCMQPGARVEMGIILRHIGAGAGLSGCLPTCPYCGSTTPILRDHDEYECIVCFKSFRASTEIASFDEPSQTHCPFSSPERPAAVHDLTPPVHQVAIVTNEVEQREPDARASESTRDFVRIRVVTLQLVAMCLNNPPRESQPEPLLDDPNPVTVEAIPTPQADPLPIGQDESTPITLPDLIAISQAEPAPTPQDEPLCTQDEPAPVLQAEPVLVSWIEPAPFPQAERAPSQSQAVNEHDEDLTTGAIGQQVNPASCFDFAYTHHEQLARATGVTSDTAAP